MGSRRRPSLELLPAAPSLELPPSSSWPAAVLHSGSRRRSSLELPPPPLPRVPAAAMEPLPASGVMQQPVAVARGFTVARAFAAAAAFVARRRSVLSVLSVGQRGTKGVGQDLTWNHLNIHSPDFSQSVGVSMVWKAIYLFRSLLKLYIYKIGYKFCWRCSNVVTWGPCV